MSISTYIRGGQRGEFLLYQFIEKCFVRNEKSYVKNVINQSPLMLQYSIREAFKKKNTGHFNQYVLQK